MAEVTSTSNANRVSQADDSEMHWHEATSKNGKKYRVGVPKSSCPDLSEQEVKDLFAGTHQGPSAGSIGNTAKLAENDGLKTGVISFSHTTSDEDINWQYTGNDDSWKKPAPRVKDLVDIDRYALCWNHLGWYDYKLKINCTETWSYTFYDETND
jgi:hypothetical protein